ncbi:unnamed protein product [Nesidiocoris tenuis]|uniref:T-cell immunomodulatory protein TIP C2 domain-containing protein n=1 Tax=Nesidiocoris tenuis TaxID=355587 RepID=A0A6H5GYX9_9HEMI|nr:unnamed protein product [Nesidiocoris tenuis]
MTSGIPAAFGDFNSDEYPDLFVIDNKDRRNIEILLGGDGDPLIKKSGKSRKCRMDYPVTSLVPGDFDGDAVMDVLVTMDRQNASTGCSRLKDTQEVRVLWGDGDTLMCNSSFNQPLFMCGQPLAMDYNMDMIIDLFGELNSKRTFWVFNKTRNYPKVVEMVRSTDPEFKALSPLRIPHSHAFLDLSSDYSPDMFVTTEAGFEIWLKDPRTPEGFVYSDETWKFPEGVKHAGQSIFLDTELKGKLDHIFPACHDDACTNSSLYVRLNNKWLPLKINFHDKTNGVWGFVPPNPSSIIQNVITLHGGDYNMDGYPDLLATLKSGTKTKTFLLKNEQCVADCAEYSRTFTIAWDELSPANNNTQLGVFYDFMQDGILDIIFVRNGTTTAFKNNLDYDANFIKVMVITGLKEHPVPVIPSPSRKKTYGTNLPGPLISYNSTDQDDKPRASVSPQLPQSAYMSLHLPYTLFGLGRTPNFVDKLTVGIYNKTRYWTQIIPNSQMVVIPIPLNDPSRWTARLFVTPSKLIVKSFIALLGTCLFLTLIIAVLWWRERREDHQEKRQESHLFHYDGM